MKIKTVESAPIRDAKRLIALIEAANEARKTAIESAAADAARLKQLDLEIEALDKKLNAEDFPGLHELSARCDQRGRFALQFAAAAAAANKAADAAADAVSDSEVSDFFWQIKAEIKSRIVSAIRPFVADDAKAARVAESCDCIVLLNRHACTWGSLPPAQKLHGLLPVLREFVSGRAPWLFGNAEPISTETNQ